MKAVQALARKASAGKQDSAALQQLQRSFDGQADAWTVLICLSKGPSPPIQEWLCSKLCELPSDDIERYLLQLVYMAAHKPSSPLERAIIQLCGRLFRVAVKVSWLLLALCQDHPTNRHITLFKEKCERAALEGKWEVPFKNPSLGPLSPAMLSPTPCGPPCAPHGPCGPCGYLTEHWFRRSIDRASLDQQAFDQLGLDAKDIITLGIDSKGLCANGLKPLRLVEWQQGQQRQQEQQQEQQQEGQHQQGQGQLPQPLPVQQIGASEGTALSAEGRQHNKQHTSSSHGGSSGVAEAATDDSTPFAASNANGNGTLQLRSHPARPRPGGVPLVHISSTGSSSSSSSNGNSSGSSSIDQTSFTERVAALRAELGDGEGVTSLLQRSRALGLAGVVVATAEEEAVSPTALLGEPASPVTQLRRDTYGASLDFLEALCVASANLTRIQPEERLAALRRLLGRINREVATANGGDVPIWWPMGQRNERVLGLCVQEAVLLNSRDKAPFMLTVEVLQEEPEEPPTLAAPPQGSKPANGHHHPSSKVLQSGRSHADASATAAVPRQLLPQQQQPPYADSVKSLVGIRVTQQLPGGDGITHDGVQGSSLGFSGHSRGPSELSVGDSAFVATTSSNVWDSPAATAAATTIAAARAATTSAAAGPVSCTAASTQSAPGLGALSPPQVIGSPHRDQSPTPQQPADQQQQPAGMAGAPVAQQLVGPPPKLPRLSLGSCSSGCAAWSPRGSSLSPSAAAVAADDSQPAAPLGLAGRLRSMLTGSSGSLAGSSRGADGSAHGGTPGSMDSRITGSSSGNGGISSTSGRSSSSSSSSSSGAVPATASAPTSSRAVHGSASDFAGLSGLQWSLSDEAISELLRSGSGSDLRSHPAATAAPAAPASTSSAATPPAAGATAAMPSALPPGARIVAAHGGNSTGPSVVEQRINAASASLRGDAPLVRLHLTVREPIIQQKRRAAAAAAAARQDASTPDVTSAAAAGAAGGPISAGCGADAAASLPMQGAAAWNLSASDPTVGASMAAAKASAGTTAGATAAGGAAALQQAEADERRRRSSHEAGPGPGSPKPLAVAPHSSSSSSRQRPRALSPAAVAGSSSRQRASPLSPGAVSGSSNGKRLAALDLASPTAAGSSSTGKEAPWLLSKLAWCKGSEGMALDDSWMEQEKLVTVHLEVAGGVDLSLVSPHRRGRRVPSYEAIDLMAGKFRVGRIPPPVESGPPLLQQPPSSSSDEDGTPTPRFGRGSGDQGSAALQQAGRERLAQQQLPAEQQQEGQQQDGQGVSEGSATAGEAPEKQAQQARVAAANELPKEQGTTAPVSQQQAQQQQQQQQQQQEGLGRQLLSVLWGGGSKQQEQAQQLRAPPQLSKQQQQQQQQQQEGDKPQPQQQQQKQKHAEESDAERRMKAANAVYGERWQHKVARIRRESPHGQLPGWGLRSVIIKSGDDCRQELLALQLISAFADIWRDAGLPLWLRPFQVVPTSNATALIEVIPDAPSIHTIKQRCCAAAGGANASLSDHFFAKFGRGSAACVAAQRRFTESLAGYSIVCYLLQIKDRHNGNILLDDAGRLVHIDFGFMLANSPGGVGFEAAPFKLTREMLEVMDSNSDGAASELFDYFKVLCIQGFLAARKHHARITHLVQLLARHSAFPCFRGGGDKVVRALEKRFALGLSEAACVQHVLAAISSSLDAWTTRQYDVYQRVLNGIL